MSVKLLRKVRQGPRVLTTFADGLMKNRYIALADWLSQITLAPLHHALIALLRRTLNGCDYTHDQGSSIDKIIEIYSLGRKA